ncbi:hypothetical protein VCUG_01135 [Vavraia culicis subsp. floridensis]|uniref:Uncharacterized protein n=1 Tax=Vavraia culicis (isolate floridensis) TaxID=948595 RepID=L2GUP8_VAVCU|nr:uncharacterized protein VCUG_01135 [Vavraia culicis subsp. floridensis]ELA47366.2 hypothetical protein VCUG_01135 [Vavraia culicis subsp. floridensis]
MVIERLLTLYFGCHCVSTRNIIIKVLANTRNIPIDHYAYQICDDLACTNSEIRCVTLKFLKRLKCVVNDENVILCAKNAGRKAYISILRNNIDITSQIYRSCVVKGTFPSFTVKEHVRIAQRNFYVQSLLVNKIRKEKNAELKREVEEKIPFLRDGAYNAVKGMKRVN